LYNNNQTSAQKVMGIIMSFKQEAYGIESTKMHTTSKGKQ